jgi:hypothetical protein
VSGPLVAGHASRSSRPSAPVTCRVACSRTSVCQYQVPLSDSANRRLAQHPSRAPHLPGWRALARVLARAASRHCARDEHRSAGGRPQGDLRSEERNRLGRCVAHLGGLDGSFRRVRESRHPSETAHSQTAGRGNHIISVRPFHECRGPRRTGLRSGDERCEAGGLHWRTGSDGRSTEGRSPNVRAATSGSREPNDP